TRLTYGGGQPVDVGYGLNRRLDRHWGVRGHHETVLQIDHDERRPARVHVVVHVQLATTLHHTVNGSVRHGEVVHGGPPFQGEASSASAVASRPPGWMQVASCPRRRWR